MKLTLMVLVGVSFVFLSCGTKRTEKLPVADSLAIQQIDLNALQQRIKQNEGKLTIINFWATWCAPCKEEMPYLLTLRKKYQADVRLLLVAIDDPEIIDTVMKPLLMKAGVDFLCYIKAEGNDEAFINGINPEWSGALPATFMYDSEGKQVEMLVGEQSYMKFEEAVKEHLEK